MKFMFSGPMLRFVDFAKEIEVAEPNLELALQALLAGRPQLKPVLLDGEGNLRRSHQMFLNGENMAANYYRDPRARSEIALGDGDSVYFLTAIAGG
ncbi:MoaD/ThiS family protein [Actinomycetes bacterium KLBMP 9797]